MNLAYIRYLTFYTNGTAGKMFECAVDGDFKLVVMAAVKNDGSTGAFTNDDIRITSGSGTKVHSEIYSTAASRTGVLGVFENVTNGSKIATCAVWYGDANVCLMCFN